MKRIHPEVLRRFGRDPRIIFERDDWKCQDCGKGSDLTIDHIDGNGRNSKYPNNDINNLRTLCRSCHGKKDIVRRWKNHQVRWTKEFKKTYDRNYYINVVKLRERGGEL